MTEKIAFQEISILLDINIIVGISLFLAACAAYVHYQPELREKTTLIEFNTEAF